MDAPMYLAIAAAVLVTIAAFLGLHTAMKAASAPSTNPSVDCWLEGLNQTVGYCVHNGTAVIYYYSAERPSR